MVNLLGQFYKILLSFLVIFLRKDDSIWIFGEASGKHYYSNTKHFFEYIVKNKKNIRAIWFTKDQKVINKIKQIDGEVYQINSFKALSLGLRARVYIHSFGRDDIVNYTLNKSIFINLYHGMNIKELSVYRRKDDLDIATSEVTKIARKKVFPNCKNVLISGEPKNDIFFTNTSKREILRKYDLEKYADKVIISYLPTYRNYRDSFKPLFSFEPELNGAVIFEKSHIAENYTEHKFKNIINLSNLDFDVQELLFITDILITDYSSCYFDFLLTERPIIFYLYDHQRYLKERGICYELDEFIIGDICKNEDQLLIEIRKYLDNYDASKDDIIKKKNKFHQFQDGNFSEMIYQEIMNLVGK